MNTIRKAGLIKPYITITISRSSFRGESAYLVNSLRINDSKFLIYLLRPRKSRTEFIAREQTVRPDKLHPEETRPVDPEFIFAPGRRYNSSLAIRRT